MALRPNGTDDALETWHLCLLALASSLLDRRLRKRALPYGSCYLYPDPPCLPATGSPASPGRGMQYGIRHPGRRLDGQHSMRHSSGRESRDRQQPLATWIEICEMRSGPPMSRLAWSRLVSGSGATFSSAGLERSGCYRDGRGSGLPRALPLLLRRACASPTRCHLTLPRCALRRCGATRASLGAETQSTHALTRAHTRAHTCTRTRRRASSLAPHRSWSCPSACAAHATQRQRQRPRDLARRPGPPIGACGISAPLVGVGPCATLIR